MNCINHIFYLLIIGLFLSCSNKSPQYSPQSLFSNTELDSIMIDAVTIMGRRPKNVSKEESRSPEYRDYYQKLATDFDLVFLTNKNDSTYYYYMLRPARNHAGWLNRGVGGYFIIDGNKRITQLTEMFNTTIIPSEELHKKGIILFEEMTQAGNIEKYLHRKDLIEWPNDRSFYDKSINEWVYINN